LDLVADDTSKDWNEKEEVIAQLRKLEADKELDF
jgi:hypothetical protein